MPRSGAGSRYQCRSSPEGAEEEGAARGYFPRDEVRRSLGKALREESPRKGGSHTPRAQARPQEAAARRSAADEAEAGVWRRSRRGARWCWRAWRSPPRAARAALDKNFADFFPLTGGMVSPSFFFY